MKSLTLCLALLFAMNATAQEAPNMMTSPPASVDLRLAGEHIEKAGKLRNRALLTVALTGALAIAVGGMDEDNVNVAAGVAGAGFAIGLGFNIAANIHEVKGGKILQGK